MSSKVRVPLQGAAGAGGGGGGSPSYEGADFSEAAVQERASRAFEDLVREVPHFAKVSEVIKRGTAFVSGCDASDQDRFLPALLDTILATEAEDSSNFYIMCDPVGRM